MKKIMLLLAATIATTMVFAQDVIVKTNEEKINAKILEISEKEVKYVEYEYQDGPTYILSTENISSIIFANGNQVKVFNHSAPQSIVLQPIYRTGNKYYYAGQMMRGDVYANFLKNNCTDAYNKYKQGNSVATAGWVLLSVGVGLDICSIVGVPYAGFFALGCELACIPTLIVGYTQMHRSAEIFNSACAANSQAYWSVTASQNGFGLALNF